MVEAADLRCRDDATGRRRHDGSRDRRVLAKREMCSRQRVVRDVVLDHPVQSDCIHDDDVIEAFTSDRADDPFHVRVRRVALVARRDVTSRSMYNANWLRRNNATRAAIRLDRRRLTC